MKKYRLKNTAAIGKKAVEVYQKIEDTVVGSYFAVESGVVKGYKQIEDAFVSRFLEPEKTDEPKPVQAREASSEKTDRVDES